ncbi:serine/threonine protein phosphatase [Bradyrhizobium sp. 157]|uniref:metallophosphoesterase family protein n=1 Tax=Bradyrhizobium sp. 157 TaxID=2782631 RepID=UPI001FF90121|nr:metallophosphoesterase family protein [Bradyrhizobium sp. 157]MCK1638038.1 serine/threonine protein phosphatase [Bradyrhizobium sp. 157]
MHRTSAGASRSVNASTPADTRIYAVGDIHGCADLLSEIIARIDEDIRRRPIAHTVEVYLGDYIDRGPHSRTVIDLLTVRLVANHAVCLRGNHEAVMEGFLQDPAILQYWLQLGGMQTLASYGVELQDGTETASDLHRRFLEAFPRTHQLFMQCLRNQFSCGDFLFVHAGIRPDVPIEHQDPNDLIWIRDAFLDSTQDHEQFIVHGHTPAPHPDVRHNRINIDTAAWRTGTLTCIAIEGSTILFL